MVAGEDFLQEMRAQFKMASNADFLNEMQKKVYGGMSGEQVYAKMIRERSAYEHLSKTETALNEFSQKDISGKSFPPELAENVVSFVKPTRFFETAEGAEALHGYAKDLAKRSNVVDKERSNDWKKCFRRGTVDDFVQFPSVVQNIEGFDPIGRSHDIGNFWVKHLNRPLNHLHRDVQVWFGPVPIVDRRIELRAMIHHQEVRHGIF